MASDSLPKENAGLAVSGDGVFAEEVVAVFVPDGNADAFVLAELIALEQAMLDAPADKQARRCRCRREVLLRTIGCCEPLPGCSPSPAFPSEWQFSTTTRWETWKLTPSPLYSRIVQLRMVTSAHSNR